MKVAAVVSLSAHVIRGRNAHCARHSFDHTSLTDVICLDECVTSSSSSRSLSVRACAPARSKFIAGSFIPRKPPFQRGMSQFPPTFLFVL